MQRLAEAASFAGRKVGGVYGDDAGHGCEPEREQHLDGGDERAETRFN